MSSLPVAARPAGAMPRIPLGLVALVMVLAVGAGLFIGARAFSTTTQVAAETTGAVKHHSGTPAARVAPMATYRQLVANLAAAEERHDFAAKARFESQLDGVLTPQLIGQIYQERERLLAALAASNRDSHAALITREMSGLCGASAVKEELAFCN